MFVPPGFNATLAIELGALVNQAYAQHEAFKNGKPWELTGDYKLISVISCVGKLSGLTQWLRPEAKGDSEPIGFVARRGKALYVIFRGTVTAKEWTQNMSFNLKEYPLSGYGKAHAGFLDVYKSLRESLFAPLLLEKGKARLYVAGHSLGGALATLAAPEIEANTRLRIASLYTFGSPRVGDDDFAQAFNRSFNRSSFRVVNTSDIVPSVPLPIPIGMGGYFSHVETPVDFTAQFGAVDKNHDLGTYLAPLRAIRRRGFFARLFRP